MAHFSNIQVPQATSKCFWWWCVDYYFGHCRYVVFLNTHFRNQICY